MTMANWSSLLLVVLVGFVSKGDSATLTFSYKSDTLTIKCAPGDEVSRIDHYFLIVLSKRNATQGSDKVIVAAAPRVNDGKATLLRTTLAQRVTARGKADDSDVQGSFAGVVLEQLTVDDGGEYVCTINYRTAWTPVITVVRENTTVPLLTAQLVFTYGYYDGYTDLNVTCRPVFVGGRMDSYMEIILAKGNDSNRIAMATRTTMGGNARMLGTSLAGRAKAFGRLNNVNVYAAFVTVAIKPAKCEDSGLYICTVGYYLHGKSYEVRDRKNTTVHTPPGLVTMVILPLHPTQYYAFGETVQFDCTGVVGTWHESQPWLWEWRYEVGPTVWTPYPFADRVDNKPLAPVGCQSEARSVLRHYVEHRDNGRSFRCVLQNGKHQASFTIYVEHPEVDLHMNITKGRYATTITCSPKFHVGTTAYHASISLERRSLGAKQLVLISVVSPGVNGGHAVAVDVSLAHRVRVSGRTDERDRNRSFLRTVLLEPTCEDNGQYICSVSYVAPAGHDTISQRQNLVINSESVHGTATMTVNAKRTDVPYSVNETVDFQCSANVSKSVTQDVGSVWAWQWRLAGNASGWTPYPFANRTTLDVVAVTPCLSELRVHLKHVVTADDDGRVFRCIMNDDESVSDLFTIYAKPFDLNVTMRWIPIHPKNVYYVGEAMQMACSYNASKPYERIPFAWQFRRQGGPLRWTAFPFRSHVNDQLVPCEGAGCQPTWLSRLHHVVAEGDDKKQFRCVAFNDQRHHGAFTIHVKNITRGI